ncbi:WXG100 family type VII secretion target [Streptomyces sp. NPDC059861]|uniref:WXG100 family type VII secretion target n=1 Tax=Streptomyces sp. NPDC059861 TaxID=3346974 RepID=UPI003666F46E
MSRNNDGLSVSYDALDFAATNIGNEAKLLEQDLQELRKMVESSRQYWAGKAQSEYGNKLARWDTEAGDIHQALMSIGQVVGRAGGTYMEGDKKAASYFL